MKSTLCAALSVALLGVAAAAGAADESPPAKSSVVATVSTLRNNNGFLICRLYKSAAGFPGPAAGTTVRRVPIGGGGAACTFDDLEPGTYAVSVFHDENGNDRLDKSFFGVPTEGYGVSNNHTHALRAPSWDESKFVVERGKTVSLAIHLRY